ncbi:hypothetical protein GCM10009611_03930 [Arthrobacter roseus]
MRNVLPICPSPQGMIGDNQALLMRQNPTAVHNRALHTRCPETVNHHYLVWWKDKAVALHVEAVAMGGYRETLRCVNLLVDPPQVEFLQARG